MPSAPRAVRGAAHAASALLRPAAAAVPVSRAVMARRAAVARRAAGAELPRAMTRATRATRATAMLWRTGRAQASCCRAGVLSAAAGRRAYSSAPAASKIWTFDEIRKLTKTPDAPVVIIDTREPGELKDTGRIPGALNIPVSSAPDSFFLPDEDFEDRFGFARPAPDTEVVFYCKAGVRSRAAAGLAREAGWTKVGEYPGSWLDWSANGGEVER